MKIKALLLLLSFFSFTYLPAQNIKSDQLKTDKGMLTITPVTHGTLVLKWMDKTIYVDPYGGAAVFSGITPPDLILITDIHGDHLDLKTLEALNPTKATFVVPQAVADMLPAAYKEKAVIIKNGNQTKFNDITITAIPMYNLPDTTDARHPKGRGNGYVLNIGGKNIYLSGDTEDIKEMRALKNIDVAFVCMNLPYTMDINKAAEAVLAFKPKIVYPYHYRGTAGLSDVAGFKKLVIDKNKNIEVRLREWYPSK